MPKMLLNKDQIKRINEIYHDLEADSYFERHPEIYYEEAAKWEEIGERYFRQDHLPLTVLDVGTGVGFVPLIIGKYLKPGDRLICTDISEKMLAASRANLSKHDHFEKKFIKGDALMIGKMDLGVNIITMNSVLHHLPDYEAVLAGMSKLLRKDGLFIIMHERNQRFSKNPPMLLRLYRILKSVSIFSGLKLLRKIVKIILVVTGRYRGKGKSKEEIKIMDFYSKVKAAIMADKISERELSMEEINAVVDIHDPDEGGEGFDPFVLQKKYFECYEIADFFTSMPLGPWIDSGKLYNKMWSRVIKRIYPNSGAIFGLVMKKMD